MAALYGRTAPRWTRFLIGDVNDVLRSIEFTTIGGVGVASAEKDVTALTDALKSILPDLPGTQVEVGGPFSNTAEAAAPLISGALAILDPLNGDPTPRSLDIQCGIRHAWEAGEPQWGISQDDTNGFIVVSFVVDLAAMTYRAQIRFVGGTVAPAWGTDAET